MLKAAALGHLLGNRNPRDDGVNPVTATIAPPSWQRSSVMNGRGLKTQSVQRGRWLTKRWIRGMSTEGTVTPCL